MSHVPESCGGYHRRHRVVHVSNDDPTPTWPEEDNRCERCACGAELELCTIVHRHVPKYPPPRQPRRPGLVFLSGARFRTRSRRLWRGAGGRTARHRAESDTQGPLVSTHEPPRLRPNRLRSCPSSPGYDTTVGGRCYTACACGSQDYSCLVVRSHRPSCASGGGGSGGLPGGELQGPALATHESRRGGLATRTQ